MCLWLGLWQAFTWEIILASISSPFPSVAYRVVEPSDVPPPGPSLGAITVLHALHHYLSFSGSLLEYHHGSRNTFGTRKAESTLRCPPHNNAVFYSFAFKFAIGFAST